MRAVLDVLGVGVISFFLGLGSVGLIGPDESRYAEVSRSMLESGDWVTPELLGQPWLDKPPLFYWSAANAMRSFGQSEAAVRLPSALAALAACLFVVWLGRRLFDIPTGHRAGLVLATCLGMVVYGRAAVMDSLLTLNITLGLGLYALYAIGDSSRFWLGLAFGAFGLAVLTKGPVGLVLPLLVILVFEGTDGRRLLPRPTSAAIAATSFLLVTAPWHIAILQAQGWEFVETFLFQHNLDRFLTTVHRHPGPFYYYLPVLMVALYPWTALFPAAAWPSTSSPGHRERARRFLRWWILVPLAFFSLAGSKLPGYILPVLPAAALLVASFWAAPARPRLVRRIVLCHAALATGLAGAAVYAFANRLPDLQPVGWTLGAVVLLFGLGSSFIGYRRPQWTFGALVASSLAMTATLLLYVAPELEPHRSLKTLTSLGAAELGPGERLICYKNFYPQAHFYAQDRLGEIWTIEELRIRAREWGRVLTLAAVERFDEVVDEPSLRTRVIAARGGKVLAEVQPAE